MANRISAHETVIKNNNPALIKDIVYNTGLIGELRRFGKEFPPFFIQNLEDEKLPSTRNTLLLNWVQKGSQERFDYFCTALSASSQHNIVETILQPSQVETSAVPVLPVDATTTAANACISSSSRQGACQECIKNMNLCFNRIQIDVQNDEGFCAQLTSHAVFTDQQMLNLQGMEKVLEKNKLLLMMLEKGSQATLTGFLDALDSTKQHHITNLFLKNDGNGSHSCGRLCTSSDGGEAHTIASGSGDAAQLDAKVDGKTKSCVSEAMGGNDLEGKRFDTKGLTDALNKI